MPLPSEGAEWIMLKALGCFIAAVGIILIAGGAIVGAMLKALV